MEVAIATIVYIPSSIVTEFFDCEQCIQLCNYVFVGPCLDDIAWSRKLGCFLPPCHFSLWRAFQIVGQLMKYVRTDMTWYSSFWATWTALNGAFNSLWKRRQKEASILNVCLLREDDGSSQPQYSENHTHQPIPVFWLSPSCGTQGSNSEDMMHRTSTLLSNSVEWEAKKKIMKALRDKGYLPPGFIHRHSNNRTPRQKEDDQRLPRTSLTLPYISGLSKVVRRVLRPLDNKVAFCPLHTLRHQLVHPKDPVPRD